VDFMKKELQGLGEVIEGRDPMASNTIYFYLKLIPSDIALALFDLNGLQISAGSACSSGSAKPSPVLLQMGLVDVAKNGLRLSLPFSLEDSMVEVIKEKLLKIFLKLHSKI
jgi:cysteine desulfurase